MHTNYLCWERELLLLAVMVSY